MCLTFASNSVIKNCVFHRAFSFHLYDTFFSWVGIAILILKLKKLMPMLSNSTFSSRHSRARF